MIRQSGATPKASAAARPRAKVAPDQPAPRAGRAHPPSSRSQAALLAPLLLAWQPLLACVWDPHPAVRAAAAPLLGSLGGALACGITPPPPPAPQLAAEARGRSGRGGRDKRGGRGGRSGGREHPGGGALPAAAVPPPALLFDWLVPLLEGAVPLPGGGGPAGPDAQAAMCHALAVAVARVAAAQDKATADAAPSTDIGVARDVCSRALGAVHALLEADGTPPALLPPLLRLVACCARCAPGALAPLWEDLTDLLLGWSLEPSLGDADRWGCLHRSAAQAGARRNCRAWRTPKQRHQGRPARRTLACSPRAPTPAAPSLFPPQAARGRGPRHAGPLLGGARTTRRGAGSCPEASC
jgi:hypothetical protein